MFDARTLEDFDAQLADALRRERQRQEQYLELIASENYVSPRVLAAQGSVLTNKYADGYPGHRHYRGCELADVAESLAIERAGKLFGAALCERAAVLRLASESRSVSRDARARRQSSRDAARARRPSHARRVRESVGPAVRRRAVRRRRRERRDRLRPSRDARARASPEARDRGLLGVLADRRLEPIPRDRGRCRRVGSSPISRTSPA